MILFPFFFCIVAGWMSLCIAVYQTVASALQASYLVVLSLIIIHLDLFVKSTHAQYTVSCLDSSCIANPPSSHKYNHDIALFSIEIYWIHKHCILFCPFKNQRKSTRSCVLKDRMVPITCTKPSARYISNNSINFFLFSFKLQILIPS